jgi:hypothetical protein
VDVYFLILEDSVVCYSGSKEQRKFGTGFLINKKYKRLVIDFSPEKTEYVLYRQKGTFFNTTTICVHAPVEEKDEVWKDVFYEVLERIPMKAPRHDIKIVMEDFNTKVGKEPGLTPNIGKYSLHEETNNNGWKMTNFAIARNMAVSSTLFQHKRIHKETWKSPYESISNQSDHVMADF